MKTIFAVSNGESYSDYTVYVFESDETVDDVASLVAEVNGGAKQFEILAGCEVLRAHIRPGSDSFALFLDAVTWSAGFEEYGGEARGPSIIAKRPRMAAILAEYKARTRKVKAKS